MGAQTYTEIPVTELQEGNFIEAGGSRAVVTYTTRQGYGETNGPKRVLVHFRPRGYMTGGAFGSFNLPLDAMVRVYSY